ncbi:hypothetical protein F5Y10DRAFT_286471 [Nemania abortiva]|nr:hypothetical protein F5Y10DRAFT_286471 [Nemania abortiva]
MPRPNGTIPGHLPSHLPPPEFVQGGEWKWPYQKFGYTHGGILFTELHAQFNSFPCAIQDPYGWHLDVTEVADIAKDRATFLALLKKRQNERFAELEKAWESMAAELIGAPSRWRLQIQDRKLWINFVRIARHFSYDSLIQYFSAYGTEGTDPRNALRKYTNPTAQSSQSSRQQPPDQTPPKIPNSRDMGPESDSQRHQGEEGNMQSTETREIATRGKGTTSTKTTGRATVRPNKIVKRKAGRRSSEGSKQDGLRRSARLRERAKREGR